MQPGLTSANCLTRKPTTSVVLEVRDSSFLLDGITSCKGTRKSATSVGGWRTGGARAYAHQPLHPLGSVLALLLWVHHAHRRSNVRMSGAVLYLASRDIVRLLPSRAGGEKEGTSVTAHVIREKRARLRSEAGAQKSSAAVLVMSL